MPHPELAHDDSHYTPTAHADATRSRAHELLLAWYAGAGRDLPWRHTRDPYAILVSEVMLQQTQVERVLPKYHQFLGQFPTLAALAAAPAADVIRAWSPLGYNVRAVRLREIARQAEAKYGGALPSTLDGLLKLKGIGRYTAGAIACFAFGLPVATVDTNIRRVLWRLFRGVEPTAWPTGQAAARAQLALAAWAMPSERAYEWQQALMDLGATVCISRQPACDRCPVASECAAYQEVARVTLFPSGDALARLREAGKTTPVGEAPSPVRRVAESHGTYRANGTGRGKPHPGQARLPFTQTTRYFRGRVLAALRSATAGTAMELAIVGPLIKPDWAPDEREWLRGIVRGLERDGLVCVLPAARGEQDETERVHSDEAWITLP